MVLKLITSFILLIVLVFPSEANAQPSPTNAQSQPFVLGILSDSSSDEYRADDNRGGTYAATTLNWLELLIKYRGFNAGVWGARPEPRRTGYEYNWARSGIQTPGMISQGQHTGLATQIQSGLVEAVYFQIGNNDYAYYNDGKNIYNGTLSGTQLTTKINNSATNIVTALNILRTARPGTKILVGTIGDMGRIPNWQRQYPDAAKRALVTNAVNAVNSQIKSYVNSHPELILFEVDGWADLVFGSVDSQGNMTVGGEKISFASNGNEPHNAILGDGIHGGTVSEGIQANFILDYINQAMGTNIPKFTDQELLINAGINASVASPTPVPVSPSQSVKLGDANNDNLVDGVDYVVWLNNYGTNVTGAANGDFDSNGAVDGVDYVVWLNNYGS